MLMRKREDRERERKIQIQRSRKRERGTRLGQQRGVRRQSLIILIYFSTI